MERWRFKYVYVNKLRVTSIELKEFLCLVFTAFCVFLEASGKDARLHAKKSPENGTWNWDPIYRHQPSSLASKHAHMGTTISSGQLFRLVSHLVEARFTSSLA